MLEHQNVLIRCGVRYERQKDEHGNVEYAQQCWRLNAYRYCAMHIVMQLIILKRGQSRYALDIDVVLPLYNIAMLRVDFYEIIQDVDAMQ